MSSFAIRPMPWAELQSHLFWARQEGWNPGLHDATPFHAQDPRGFFLGEIDGEPIGMVAGVRYGTELGFVGLYIVRPPWRRQGYGIQLWQAALSHLQGRVIGLDGVLDRQADYVRSGFELAWRNQRFEGHTPGVALTIQPDIHPLNEWDWEQVLALDARCFGALRSHFLQSWLSQPGVVAMGHGTSGQLDAFGMARPCGMGYKIGPLFAPGPLVARAVVLSLLSQLPRSSVFQVDIPAHQLKARALFEGMGMRPVFETARMYRGTPPRIPLEQVFGITSLELG
jgi:GNAT superfamily N-acetyltransferase